MELTGRPEGYHMGAGANDTATAHRIRSGAWGEVVCGAVAIVLAIIGLAGAAPPYLLSIAVIAAGAALMFEGGTIASRVKTLLTDIGANTTDTTTIGSGVTTEFIAGCTGVALGILSLIGVFPGVLNPIAIIAMGGGLVLGSGLSARLYSFVTTRHIADVQMRSMTRSILPASSGAQLFFGLAAIALGIIALIGFAPIALTEIGILLIGTAVIFSGTAIGSFAQDLFRHV